VSFPSLTVAVRLSADGQPVGLHVQQAPDLDLEEIHLQEAPTTDVSKQPEPPDQIERGLTTKEAKERLAKVGPNEQAPARRAWFGFCSSLRIR